jgi:hypothetical protein
MSTIKTNLRTTFTDTDGNINLNGTHSQRAFNGVFALGLIMGSEDKESRQLQVDKDQLPAINNALNHVINDCLYGLAGIGALIRLSNPTDKLSEDESEGLGLVIQQLSLLAIESRDYQESLGFDMDRRNK